MNTREKKKAYEAAVSELRSLIAPEDHWVSKMATINCVLRTHLPYYFWTGFYIVHNNELIVGPYQGTLGCLHIAYGKGVCGTAWKEEKTQVVPDVHQFPGHIACDSKSNSEIVVPVWNEKKEIIAVFDVDSTDLGSFDDVDKKYLEEIMHEQFATRGKPKEALRLSTELDK